MRKTVLNLPLDVLTKEVALSEIREWLRSKQPSRKIVVTAYSEFYVVAQKDLVFANILRKADMVTPDGVSTLAAVKYIDRAKGKNIFQKLFLGLKIGGDILSGEVGETVTGVFLFEKLTSMSEKFGWKIFLLGGWDDVSLRTAKLLLKRFPKIRLAYDSGEKYVGTDKDTDERVMKKINAFKPDILFVQYNPVKQEKWIASHLNKLQVGVAIGVGGTFNEYLGEFKKSPIWMERMGLKWLWRLMVEPKRFSRIMRAVFVFPWLVFKNSL